MNNLDKKIALVNAITELSIKITQTTKADVFCDYSGHVNGLTVRVMLNGWQPDYIEPNYSKIIYLDRCKVNDLEEIVDYLQYIKEEK